MKKSLVEKRSKRGVGASGEIGTLLLLVLDPSTGLWVPTSSSCSLMGLAEGLIQKLHQAQDPGAIIKDRGLNVIFPNRLAKLLDIELLEL